MPSRTRIVFITFWNRPGTLSPRMSLHRIGVFKPLDLSTLAWVHMSLHRIGVFKPLDLSTLVRFHARNLARNLLASEPSRNRVPEPCRPGTFPERVVRNLPRNLPGTSRNLPPGSRPGTAPEPILAKTP